MINEEQYRELLAVRLYQLRKARGYTIKQVAQILGKKWQAYAAHEDKRSAPSTLEMIKLRELYGFESVDAMVKSLAVRSN